MISALLAVSAAAPLTIPASLQGAWDLPGACRRLGEESDSRLLVRRSTAVFGESVFTPKRVLNADPANWTATGVYDEEGETSQGPLMLRLSKDGQHLSYTNFDNRIGRLNRCAKK